MNCKNCKRQGCSFAGKSHEMLFECRLYVGKTNADRIRAMTCEELETLISSDFCEIICSPETNCQYVDCRGKILDWLRQEVEE